LDKLVALPKMAVIPRHAPQPLKPSDVPPFRSDPPL
jgi:hypothetical protein